MTPDDDLIYLAETDELYAHSKARVSSLEYRLKVEESRQYLNAQGKSVEDRKSSARISEGYCNLLTELEEASITSLTLQAKRTTASLRIDVWRTQESSKRSQR